MLSARDLQFRYPSGEFTLGIPELAVKPGEALGIMGPSGAGKTTLLRLLTGILVPDQGTVRLSETQLDSMTERARREFRLEKLGLVFQDFALLDYLSVADNLLLPLRLSGALTEEHQMKAQALLERLEMMPHWKHLTSKLSQGERQRVAVARALLHEPLAVFADEPTSSLDGARKDAVMALLTEDAKKRNTALIVVTHDVEMQRWFDRVVNFTDLKA